MARTYRLGPARRLTNMVITALIRVSLAPPHYVLVTVVGRTTGRRHSTPIRPVQVDRQRYLVAPYGAVAWVRNARAAGQVTLSRGRRHEAVTVQECTAEQSAPVLRHYVRVVPVTRPYVDAGPDDPLERFIGEATHHPVFRITS